jgi:hypothetical protein
MIVHSVSSSGCQSREDMSSPFSGALFLIRVSQRSIFDVIHGQQIWFRISLQTARCLVLSFELFGVYIALLHIKLSSQSSFPSLSGSTRGGT